MGYTRSLSGGGGFAEESAILIDPRLVNQPLSLLFPPFDYLFYSPLSSHILPLLAKHKVNYFKSLLTTAKSIILLSSIYARHKEETKPWRFLSFWRQPLISPILFGYKRRHSKRINSRISCSMVAKKTRIRELCRNQSNSGFLIRHRS